jgi:putative sterol carrier protein
VSLNLVVTGGPQGDRELHVANGTFAAGLEDGAPTKLTVPYDVARNMFVKGDQAAAMQAFMSGQIKVEGDMTKLMAMQSSGGGGADAAAIQEKLREITADD